MEIPPQNRAENFASYVLRVCSTIETVRIPLTSEANSFRESTKDKDSRVEKVNGKNINCTCKSKKNILSYMYLYQLMGVFCDRLKFGSTAALHHCRSGQNKGRYCKKELLLIIISLLRAIRDQCLSLLYSERTFKKLT